VGEFVRLEVSDSGVGTIRLDRPKVNALSGRVVEEVSEAVEEATGDDAVRAVVVWGGERVFAAGADIGEMRGLDVAGGLRYIELFQDAFARLERMPKVTIAAVNGYALGGGCELALACDFRFAALDARLGQPEIQLGVIPGAGGTQRLPRLIGRVRAKEIIYSGRAVPADRAHDMGLVDRVLTPGEVYPEAVTAAERYAEGPTVALGAAKRVLQAGLEADLSSGLLLEKQAFASLFATEDCATGMSSFLESGPGRARFVGR
jgi:enoyl-CoA hydratase/carnithine racemase